MPQLGNLSQVSCWSNKKTPGLIGESGRCQAPLTKSRIDLGVQMTEVRTTVYTPKGNRGILKLAIGMPNFGLSLVY
jgi:hypothetical protein